MKNMIRRFVTNAFALTVAANGATVLAQNTPQDKPQEKKVERQVWVDSSNQTFDIRTIAPGQIGDGIAPRVMTFAGTGNGQDSHSYSFITSEVGSTSKVVKGSPYSAEVVNEFVQTLSNGNRIVRRNSSNVYRDTQGRMRREHSLPTPPGAPVELANTKFITLTDTVEGVTYMLNEKNKTAQRVRIGSGTASFIGTTSGGGSFNSGPMTIVTEKVVTATSGQPVHGELLKKITVSGGVLQNSAINKVQPVYPQLAKASKASGAVQVQVTINETGDVVNTEVISGHPLLRDAALEAARQWKFKPTELSGQPVKVQGVVTFNFSLKDDDNTSASHTVSETTLPGQAHDLFVMSKNEHQTTSLGKQMVEGVECEGTRIVLTIPAGQVGNEQPIEIVTERWFSPELQLTVLSKHNDPRNGETIVKMTNLTRSEPDAQLFKVPSDYTIKEGNGQQVIIRTSKPE